MALDIIVLIVLALIIGLVGIGMAIRERLKRVASYGGAGIGYAGRVARRGGAYASRSARAGIGYAGRSAGSASRYARSRLPKMDLKERDEYLRREQNRYEEFHVSGELGPITSLFSVITNVAEYFTIGRYRRRHPPPDEPTH